MVARIAGPVPSSFGMSMPVVSMMKKGLPPARSAISYACCSGIRPPPDCRTRLIDSEGDSRSRRSSTEFPLVDPQSRLSSTSSSSGRAADDRGRGRERRRIGVGAWLASQHSHRGASTRGELVGEAGFADAGLAEDSHEHWTPGGGCQAEALIEDGLLAGAADEWDGSPRGSHLQPIDRESIETRGEALGFDVAATPGQGTA